MELDLRLIQELVNDSWVDGSDVKDLVEILREDDPIAELKKINGDRIMHLRWLLSIIAKPSIVLKETAVKLLDNMDKEKIFG